MLSLHMLIMINHIIMVSDIDDIESLINQQNWHEMKKVIILKVSSNNFCKYVHNF